MSNDQNRGEDILRLLEDFPSKPLIDEVRPFYDNAYHNRESNSERAINDCSTALDILENPSPETLPGTEDIADAKGRFHLLLASIHLNQETELEQAEEHYRESQTAYHIMQWSHLESLTYLGLAITLRKLGRLREASAECENAHDEAIIANQRTIQDLSEEAVQSLREAIAEERRKIQSLLHPVDQQQPPDELTPTPPPISRRTYMICDIAEGKNILERKPSASTDFHPLISSNYQLYFREEIFNIAESQKVDYILRVSGVNEIRGRINERGEELEEDHLLLIQSEGNPKKLNGEKVAVLVLTRTGADISTCATLKTFIYGEDHCLLKGIHPEDSSIAVRSYKTKSEMDRYYEEYRPFTRKFAYDVAVSGKVLAVIHSNQLQ